MDEKYEHAKLKGMKNASKSSMIGLTMERLLLKAHNLFGVCKTTDGSVN